MIYYRNRRNYIKQRTIKMPLSVFQGIDELSHEDTLPIKYTREMIGYTPHKGVLYNSECVRELRADDGDRYAEIQFAIDNIYPFYLGGKRQLIASSNTRAFVLDEAKKIWKIVPNTYFSGRNSVYFTVDERQSLIIPKRDGGLYSYNGYDFIDMKLPYAPTCMAVHMNRLFLVDEKDEYRLHFSGVNNPKNFKVSLEDGGEIYLDIEDGKIIGMISVGGNLYIFREYAIYKLTAYGDQRDFMLRKIVETESKIDAGTIALHGATMLMKVGDKMMIFDGYSLSEILCNMPLTLGKMATGSTAKCYQGKYYLAYRLEGESANSHLIIYDLKRHELSMLEGVSIKKFAIMRGDEERLLVVEDGAKHLGYIAGGDECNESVERRWKSGKITIDGDYKTKKRLVGISVHREDRYTITIEASGDRRKRITLDGREIYYPLDMESEWYEFTISSSGNNCIHSPIIEVKV